MAEQLKPGLHERLLTQWVEQQLKQLEGELESQLRALNAREARTFLSRLVAKELETALRSFETEDGGGSALTNALLARLTDSPKDALEGQVVEPVQLLQGLRRRELGNDLPAHPVVPLTQSALIVNDDQKLSVGASLKRELVSADRVDLICAFVSHSGVRILEEEIRALHRRGGELRLVTTTYLGATQRKALDQMCEWGAKVKVVYELPPSNTKLHAKAWLFHRDSGYTTATIGSSNLSHTALVDGLEWNVRLSAVDAPQVLAQFQSTFDRYWASSEFEDYVPGTDGERLEKALRAAGKPAEDPERIQFFLDLKPWPHQKEILDAIELERARKDKWKNLVVAATGTGKTIVAALDFKRLRGVWGDPSLLFVAHRREILKQALAAYRHVLRDASFGELWVDGAKPTEYRHVFASIQSITALKDLSALRPDQFDVVVMDEFHHAEASTYKRLLEHIQPRCLLGLTATPERSDGVDVADYFGGSTIEIRLWDALERSLLCPFQYFGVADQVDLSDLAWDKGYLTSELDEKYVTNGHARARLIADQTIRIVTDMSKMQALGFCASIKHARFMAAQFNEIGIPSAHLDSGSTSEERDRVRRSLQKGAINCIFTVDLFNEGVDLPEVNTILFLRPTESATVFIQQFGRGLRLSENKTLLTVLDFIGFQHSRFRFDFRFRALTGFSRTQLKHQLEGGFPALPAGCHIQLDRESKRAVLENLKGQIPTNARRMAEELKLIAAGDSEITVGTFLRSAELEPEDLYQNSRTFTELKRRAGLLLADSEAGEKEISNRLKSLVSVNDPERLGCWCEWLAGSAPPEIADLSEREKRLLYMLSYTLVPNTRREKLQEAVHRLWSNKFLRGEAADLLNYLDSNASRLTRTLEIAELAHVPLQVHADYSKGEIMAAFDMPNPESMRQGVFWFSKDKTNVFIPTLRKSEELFSPTTRYDDRFISPTELHWESQNSTGEDTITGRRYQHHDREGSHVFVFVREAKFVDGRAAPYLFLGPAHYVRHESERPMRIVWRLDYAVPEALYQPLKAAAG